MSPRATARLQLLGAALLFSTCGAAIEPPRSPPCSIILGATTARSLAENRIAEPVT
jgi:hypothetical protein